MKRIASTLLVLMTLINTLPAQDDYRKSITGANAGVTIPFADFAGNKMEPSAGFASTGMNIDGDLLLFTGRYFGFTSGIGYASVFFAERDYRAEYDRMLDGYGQNRVSVGNYQVLKGMLGFAFRIPVTGHVEALITCQAGVAFCVHPDLMVTNTELGTINTINRNSTWSPVSSAGVKINYWLNEKYGINLNYSLNATKPGFDDQTGTGGNFYLPVRYMNINAGVVVSL
jgi:hypothetical protein